MKTIRKAVFRSKLEAQLSKYERRIQKMAENAYKVRQVLEQLYREEQKNAVHQSNSAGRIGPESTDQDAGESQLPDNQVADPVLAEQSTELPSN